MDGGKAVTFCVRQPGATLNGRTHLHDIYAKAAARADGVPRLTNADPRQAAIIWRRGSHTVIRERPEQRRSTQRRCRIRPNPRDSNPTPAAVRAFARAVDGRRRAFQRITTRRVQRVCPAHSARIMAMGFLTTMIHVGRRPSNVSRHARRCSPTSPACSAVVTDVDAANGSSNSICPSNGPPKHVLRYSRPAPAGLTAELGGNPCVHLCFCPVAGRFIHRRCCDVRPNSRHRRPTRNTSPSTPRAIKARRRLITADGTRMGPREPGAPGRLRARQHCQFGQDGMLDRVVIRGFTPNGDAAEEFAIKDGSAT